jgi:hypothetical protein
MLIEHCSSAFKFLGTEETLARRSMDARFPSFAASIWAKPSSSPGRQPSASICQGRRYGLRLVEGELQASDVAICKGAQVEDNIVAKELAVGGRVQRHGPRCRCKAS